MFADYLRIALRSIAKRRTRTYLTMIGIFIGIAAVVSLMGLGQGLRVAITSQFGILGTDVLSVRASGASFGGPPGAGALTPLTKDLVDKIDRINGVDVAFARYIESGTMEFNDEQVIGFATSIPSGDERKVVERMLNLETEQGRLLRDDDVKGIVLGNNFKNDDTFGRGITSGDRVLLNDVEFRVVGILEKKGSFLLDGGVFLNEKAMFDFLETDEDEVDIIAIKVKDEKEIDAVQKRIENLLRKERDVDEGEEDFEVQSPQAMLESLDSTLFAVQLFVTIIALISLLVGGIGIMNTMYTAVLERTKEIGIMKSIGARNSTIFTLFFIESGFLGMVGGIIGIILGMIFAYGLAAIGRLALGADLIQASIGFDLIIGALIFSFVMGTIFGVMPAVRASKLNPVDSLRRAK
ncbi:MAG: ABC transporter permease [Nanoarchaeota archaeon]|nr:ABC transporter permease [Nanoarchaeota archaeon]MBU1322268.1 ABC transporter permease [Nanoarchaeota archaeon]MBU1598021.1 ABC transporter permease [Nanoarchaeota archaeon]MBU2441013.1 ABC transporter permease [Nanoarchaeota archaeon]